MDGYNRRRNRASTQERCARTFASADFDTLRTRIVTETRAERFLEVLTAGGNATNHYPRRLHNFSLGMGYTCSARCSLPKSGRPCAARSRVRSPLPSSGSSWPPDKKPPSGKPTMSCFGPRAAARATSLTSRPKTSTGATRTSNTSAPSCGQTRGRSSLRIGGQMIALLERLPRRGPFFPRVRRSYSSDRASGGQAFLDPRGSRTLPPAVGHRPEPRSGEAVEPRLGRPDRRVRRAGRLEVANASGTGPASVSPDAELRFVNGSAAGPVTLQAGGAIVPGDPVTLTFENNLTWDAGGLIQLVLGADTASSDQLDVLGALNRGDLSAGGGFTIDLLNGGIVVGQTYDLFHYGSLQGFSPGDFTLTGATGNFALADGALSLTVTGLIVPEPGTCWLLLVGAVGG